MYYISSSKQTVLRFISKGFKKYVETLKLYHADTRQSISMGVYVLSLLLPSVILYPL